MPANLPLELREEFRHPYGGRYFKAPNAADIERLIAAEREWGARREADLKAFWPRSALPYTWMVARKMLACHAKRVDEQTANLVIETLAEKIYSHGHAIGRAEAKEIGLPVAQTDDALDDLLWELLEEYESLLELRRPLDPNAALPPDVDEIDLPTTIAAVETSEASHEFKGTLKFKRVRQAPQQINLNMKFGVALPPNLDPQTLPQELQNAINQMIQQVQSDAPKWVQEQTKKQSPVIRVEGRLEDAYWQEPPVVASGPK